MATAAEMGKVYRSALKTAMNPAPDTTGLSARTLQEQEAGRNRLMKNLRESIVDVGVQELQRRFTKASVPEAALNFVREENRWTATVTVRAAAGASMRLEYDLMEFPSDELIAQIALIV